MIWCWERTHWSLTVQQKRYYVSLLPPVFCQLESVCPGENRPSIKSTIQPRNVFGLLMLKLVSIRSRYGRSNAVHLLLFLTCLCLPYVVCSCCGTYRVVTVFALLGGHVCCKMKRFNSCKSKCNWIYVCLQYNGVTVGTSFVQEMIPTCLCISDVIGTLVAAAMCVPQMKFRWFCGATVLREKLLRSGIEFCYLWTVIIVNSSTNHAYVL